MIIIQIVEDDRTLNNGITIALSGNDRSFVQSFSLAQAKGGYREKGADDYISKPFSLAVLRARAEALHRRN